MDPLGELASLKLRNNFVDAGLDAAAGKLPNDPSTNEDLSQEVRFVAVRFRNFGLLGLRIFHSVVEGVALNPNHKP